MTAILQSGSTILTWEWVYCEYHGDTGGQTVEFEYLYFRYIAL